jgi:hypothetical protein
MTSILTGDIINSRFSEAELWMDSLKEILIGIGKNPKEWEIYGGDSFQVEIKDPKETLFRAIQIKAAIKCIKNVDVRLSIGIGEKNYDSDKITESNGTAFIYSGEGLNAFKNQQTLSVHSGILEFDYEINLLIKMSLIVMDNWTPAVAEYVTLNLSGKWVQQQIANKLGISQSSVSERHKRSYINEIHDVEKLYRNKIEAFSLDK